MRIIRRAIDESRPALSEYESKQVLASYGIPVTREILVHDSQDLLTACREIGYPVVLKGCSSQVSHKTEKDLIRIDIRNETEAFEAYEHIMMNVTGVEGAVMAQEMLTGKRELVIGMTRDPQFGPCVMFGLGGIFTEILQDIAFRVAPLNTGDAMEMMQEIRGYKILEAVRGMEAADLTALSEILIAVGRIGLENEKVKEIDINPTIICGSKAVAADALIVLDQRAC